MKQLKEKGRFLPESRKGGTTVSLLLLLVLLFAFSGCGQASPAVQSTQEATGNSEAKASGTVINNEPTGYTDYYTGYGGQLAVSIDAVVESLDEAALPVYEFYYTPFTQQDVDLIIGELIGNADLHFPDYFALKDVLKERLEEIKANLAEAKKAADGLAGGLTVAELERQIKETEEAIALAPDSPDGKITSKYFSEHSCITATAMVEGRGMIDFTVYTSENNVSTMEFYAGEYYSMGGTTEAGDLGLTITKEEAVKTAVKMAAAIGAEGFAPVAVVEAQRAENGDFSIVGNIQKAYSVILTRGQDNRQTLFTGLDQSFGEDIFADDIADRTQYENLKIIVDNKGVAEVIWTAHGSLGREVSDRTSMLSFDKVMEKFQQQVLYNYSKIEPGKKFILDIDRIKLGYLPVYEKSAKEYYWEPVWAFYGNGQYEGEESESAGPVEKTLEYRPVIILDAVDGRNIVC